MSANRHSNATLLVDALRDPATTARLDADGWNALIAMARAEQLIGTLAFRLDGQATPAKVVGIMADAKIHAEYQRHSALWEADCARRALTGIAGKLILMKGTAYAAARLDAATGRSIGDLDILVAKRELPAVEAALLDAGWEWVKQNAYDDAYYRQWMHELPPLIHRERDRMIDVHHTILPLTARPKPDAAAMIDAAITLEPAVERRVVPRHLAGKGGLHVLAPADMVCHCAVHLFADGDLSGGLRNLWDIDRLVRQFANAPNFADSLHLRAQRHGVGEAVARALRLSHALYGTPVDPELAGKGNWRDTLFIRRLLARNGDGRQTRPFTRLGFYIRGHLLRMPLNMLIPHLWTKWRKPPS